MQQWKIIILLLHFSALIIIVKLMSCQIDMIIILKNLFEKWKKKKENNLTVAGIWTRADTLQNVN